MTRRAPLTLALLVAMAMVVAVFPSGVQAQAPDAAVAAARADLGARLGADPAGLELLRVEAVIWNNGCIGAAEQNEACTEALVDGFAIWLSDGEVAYRYHSDATANALRLGESMIPLSQVPVAPLPQGAMPASALDRFLDLLAGAGFGEILVRELAVLRDWIPGSFSPHYIVGEATLELFEVPSAAEAEAAVSRLRQLGGDADLGEDQTLWRFEELIVILLSASERAGIQGTISDLIGQPLVSTPLAEPRPRPDAAALETSVSAVLDALRWAGIEARLTELAAHRPFLPMDALSAVVRVDGGNVEVFGLQSPAEAALALAKAAEDATLATTAAIWTRGSTLVVIQGPLAADQRAVIDAVSEVLGAPDLIGDKISGSDNGPAPGDAEEPTALPTTGNGGIESEDDSTPVWVWGVIAAVAVAAIAAGGAYRLWLRSRSG